MCQGIGIDPTRLHRKAWEHAAVCQTFCDHSRGPDFNAIGFGCGKEPVVRFLAGVSTGRVVATDAPITQSTAHWLETNQHLSDIIPGPPAESGLSYRECDMRSIPSWFLTGDYDFTWSCGSFEHIGGIDAGLEFFCNQMRCLRPSGIAAHTTEFDVTSNSGTLETPDLSIFRKRDFEKLGRMLAAQGDRLFPLDWSQGEEKADKYIDHQPYEQGLAHLVIELGGYTFTSFILIARRGQEVSA
jgi:hypothetical protein